MAGPDQQPCPPRPRIDAAALALLLLGDGRFPAGGHAHSAGAESAVADGRITDLASLEAFVVGRLWTAGLSDAALAPRPSGCLGVGRRRTGPSAPAIVTARRRGRRPHPDRTACGRRRAGSVASSCGCRPRCWPAAVLVSLLDELPDGAPPARRARARWRVAAGLTPGDVARLTVHHALTTPAQAALRLLGLDPYEVAALTVRLGDGRRRRGRRGASRASTAEPRRPAGPHRPVVEIAAVEHRAWDHRLFAT